MFTGIVEEAAKVLKISENPHGIRLSVATCVCGEGARLGDSIAVNGCCLTAVNITPTPEGTLLEFDLLRETWNRTNLRHTRQGSTVNLERSLAADGRVHGHFVTGHIDDTAEIGIFEKRGADFYLRVVPPPQLLRYIVSKGAIALDGISLTVADVDTGGFAVWIIPHTYEVTALKNRAKGDLLNVEVDILSKYVEKFVQPPAA